MTEPSRTPRLIRVDVERRLARIARCDGCGGWKLRRRPCRVCAQLEVVAHV